MMVNLWVSDWNGQDKWYCTTDDALATFKNKVINEGVKIAWDWLQHEKEKGLFVRCDSCVNHGLDEYFFDYNEPNDSVCEWEVR